MIQMNCACIIKLFFPGYNQTFYKLHKGYRKSKKNLLFVRWLTSQCNPLIYILVCCLPILKGGERCWLRLFGGRTSEHGPGVCLFTGSSDFGEHESSHSRDVEEVEGVHTSFLRQPGDDVVQVLDVFLGTWSCTLAWDFLYFFLFFLVGDSLLDLFICHILRHLGLHHRPASLLHPC